MRMQGACQGHVDRTLSEKKLQDLHMTSHDRDKVIEAQFRLFRAKLRRGDRIRISHSHVFVFVEFDEIDQDIELLALRGPNA